MKKIILGIAIAIFGLSNAQTDAFKGQGDIKAQVGANFQDTAQGIVVAADFGLGDSFSLGLQSSYILGYSDTSVKPEFGDKFDAKVRANAHLGKVIGFPNNFDVYPGLDLGLRNFGAHAGARYFFEKGFGLFAELQFPIAKFNKDAIGYKLLNNQFNFSIGAAFDISK